MKKMLLNILKIAIFFIGWAILSGIIEISNNNPAIWRFFAELIPMVVVIVFTIVFSLLEKREVKIPITDNIGKGTLIGTVTGIVWICAAAGLLLLLKQLSITAKNEISMLWLWIISAFINVIMQELLVRGYIYQLFYPHMLTMSATVNTFLSGGDYKIEGSIVTLILNITLMIVFYVKYRKENGEQVKLKGTP